MRSTFFGLETARRGMFTQQSALYTTGQNIANANTPGYSRQRINFEQTEPYPPAGLNRPQIPGQMGTGVEAGSVQRVREGFLDLQYRGENNKLGYWEAKSEALTKMEDIMNEPSDEGLAKTMDRFWQSLQDLAVNPQDSGARSVVRQRGIAVAETFSYLSDSLTSIQTDFANQIEVTMKSVNSLANQIANINKQISEIEPHGYLPNDLYDERDRLLDELSNLTNIEVKTVPTGGNALDIAEGMYDVSIVTSTGTVSLVSGTTAKQMTIQPSATGRDQYPTGVVESISIGGTAVTGTLSGKLQGMVEAFGYKDATGTVKGLYPDMLNKLDKMAYDFVKQFNTVHEAGYSLKSATEASQQGYNFFENITNVSGAAKAVKVDQAIMADLNHIAASSEVDQAGNGENALLLAGVQDTNFTAVPGSNITGTIRSFYQGVIGEMAVQSQEANRLLNNSEVLRQSVDERRQSVSAVSLDEEMTNMVKFQHAYNASARNITIIDEMLDKIINGLGTGGR